MRLLTLPAYLAGRLAGKALGRTWAAFIDGLLGKTETYDGPRFPTHR